MTTNRRRAIFRAVLGLSTALSLIGLGQGSAVAKETIRWKFKEGQVWHYSMDQNTVQSGQDPEGREQKQTYNLIMDMTWTIKSVDPSGVATISQTIDRLRTTVIGPFGKFSFDSKEAGNAPGAAGPMFEILLGAEFTSKMNPRGELSDIKLSEKMLSTLKGENDPMVTQGPFSEAGLKNMVAQMITPLPEGAVDVGETWKRTLAVPAGPDGQTRQIEQNFSYKGKGAEPASSGLETIEFSTKLDPPKTDPNIPVTVKKESQTGRIEFDNAAGRVVKSSTEEVMEFSMAAQGKDVTQKAQITRLLSLLKEKAP